LVNRITYVDQKFLEKLKRVGPVFASQSTLTDRMITPLIELVVLALMHFFSHVYQAQPAALEEMV
jgi:hypothetical protein